MKRFVNIKYLVAAGMVLGAFLSSCTRIDEKEGVPSVVRRGACGFVMEPETYEGDGMEAETKSVLTAADIETKKTCGSVALYKDGTLVGAKDFTGTASEAFPELPYGQTYTAYALVNMGAMASSFPSDEASVAGMVYNIPSYTEGAASVSQMGIPMAGSKTFQVSGGTETIPVKRLLAKVNVNLNCDWDGAKIASAKVYNMNKVLKPFGTSAATGAADMLSFQDLVTATTAGKSLSGVFYVPENMQGTVSGVTESKNKGRDKNAFLAANADKLTYLQVEVSTDGMYEGTVSYRSYLGKDELTDLNIERNRRYAWNVTYKWDTIDEQPGDWKHELDLSKYEYTLSLSPNPKTVSVGGTFDYVTTLNLKRSEWMTGSDAVTVHTSASNLPNNQVTWSSSDATKASVNGSGRVTGVAKGTATMTAKYTPSGADFSEISATASVEVVNTSYEIDILYGGTVVNGTLIQKNYDESIPLTAKLYTVTNGVRDGGVDITTDSHSSWLKAGSTSYNINEGSISVGTHTGVVSATDYGRTTIEIKYSGLASAMYNQTVNVQFNKTEYFLDVTATPSEQDADKTIQMSAKLRKVANGVTTTSDLAASAVTWSVKSKTVPAAVVSVTSAGVVSTDRGTGAVITGTYVHEGKTLTADASVSFGAVVSKYIEIIASPSTTANVGSTIQLTAKLHTVTDGVDDGGVVFTPAWSRKSGASTISVAADGKTTATAGGTATIQAAPGSYTAAAGAAPATVDVTFNDVITHRLVLSADNVSVPYNGTIQLNVKYYTTTNGVEDAGVDKTATASYTKAPGTGSNVTITSAGKATLTDPTKSVVSNNKTSVTAVFGGITSNALDIEFTNVTTYAYTRLVVTGDSAVAVGAATSNYVATLYTQTSVNGVVSGSPTASDVSTSATFASSDTGKATVSGRKATGVANGTTYISATYTGPHGTIATATADRCQLVVSNVVSHRLVLSADKTSVTYAGTIHLTAKYYTTTNGTEDAGVNVTASATYQKVGTNGSNVNIQSSGVVCLLDPSLSVVNNNKATIKATYNGTSSNEVSVEFTNVTSYVYTRLVVTGDAAVSVGASTSDYVATLYTQTRVNGVASGSPTTSDVSASASFASSDTGKATMSGRKATGVASGTTYITATYSGPYGAIITADADRCKLIVNDVVEDRYRIVLAPASSTINWNATQNYTVNRYTDRYVNNVLSVSGTVATAMSVSDFTWSGSNAAVATVNASTGVATGVSAGTVTVTATLKSSVSEYAKYSNKAVTASLTVKNVYGLVVEPDGATLRVGSTQTYKAYLVTNGVKGSTALSSGVTWSVSSGSSYASINPTTGAVTGVAAGTARVKGQYTDPNGTVQSAEVTLTVIPNAGGSIDTGWDDGGEIGL